MKQLLLYVQDPNALKNWSKATELPKKVLYTLPPEDLYNADEVLLLIQLSTEAHEQKQIANLIKRGFKVLLLSNEPAADEGIEWFQKGVKGYLNTYASTERITQAVETIQAGSIWLGQTVMQRMIEAITAVPVEKSEGWKALLTEREIETVNAVLKGMSNQEIAQLMDISERTVKAHMHSILEKMAVKDRLALVLKIQNW